MRSSRSCGDIIATGVLPGADGGSGSVGAGKFAGIGSGGTGRASTGSPGSVRASRGAMIAFSTLAEPQIGQVTSARLACLS